MKKILFLLLIGLIFCFVSCGKVEEKSTQESEVRLGKIEEEKMVEKSEEKYVEGEVLVKFKPELNQEEILRIIKEEYNCEILDLIKGLDVYRLRIPKGKTVPEMVEILNKDERVKYAEPNFIYRLQY